MREYSCLNCGKSNIVTRQKSNKYCDNKCQELYQYKSFVEQWLAGLVTRPSRHYKRYILEQQDQKCAVCGLSEWNGKPIVLELEHKDGDSSNNHVSNLECLCPNCHSQTPTFKGANRGNGRHTRRIRYAEGKSF